MNIPTILIIIALFLCFLSGFLLGWICRSALFTKDKDCANPAHQDWDYRKER